MSDGIIIAFVIWAVCGAAFIVLGVWEYFSKAENPKSFSFWANAEQFKVKDVKKYNRAVAKLWMVFGTVFILLGLPMFGGQNSPWIMLSIIGTMFEAIAAMAVYTLVIERKYKL